MKLCESTPQKTRPAPETESFSVLERLLLLHSVLPREGDITTIRLVRKLREALSFSESEHAALNIHELEDKKGTVWNRAADKPKVVDIGPKMREVIVTGLKQLSKKSALTDDHLALCDRFLFEEET